MATAKIIKAAGGLVERCTPHGVEIALIHRTRYGSEWCLPKGKLKTGETWDVAALREVREETGFDCSLSGLAGANAYLVQNTPKTVLIYRMLVQGEANFKANDEVDSLAWLSPVDAIGRLTHPEDIELVLRTYGLEKPPGRAKGLYRFWLAARTSFQFRRKGRLASSISVYRQELQLRSLTSGRSTESSLVLSEVCSLLHMADKSVATGDIDMGWKCFLAAQRMEVFLITQAEDLKYKALVLREESSKLSSWRKAAIDRLLGTSENPQESVEPSIVYEALLLRDEHYSNEAYKSSLKRDFNLSLSVILGLVLFSIFYMLRNEIIFLGVGADEYSWEMIASVCVFGLLGAVVSAIIREMDVAGKPSKIPEIVTAIRVTVLRIFVGSAFALVVYLFMKSQLTQLFAGDIATAVTTAQPFTIYAISFVVGFTERLVLSAVGVVAGSKAKNS